MNRQINLPWYIIVIFSLGLLICLKTMIGTGMKLFYAFDDYSPLLPEYAKFYNSLLYLAPFIAAGFACFGLPALYFNKKQGWILSAFGTVFLSFYFFDINLKLMETKNFSFVTALYNLFVLSTCACLYSAKIRSNQNVNLKKHIVTFCATGILVLSRVYASNISMKLSNFFS